MFLLSLWIHERITGQPANMPDPPALAFIGVAAYGVLANVCYMGGWLVELLVRWLWREDGTTFASIAFTLGLAFSVALTLLLGVGFSLAVVAAAFVQ